MRILKIDSLGGASGDMLLGAAIGLGADLSQIKTMLDALLPGHFDLQLTDCIQSGISGTHLKVVCDAVHHHHHGDGEQHQHHDHHHYSEIAELINLSKLPDEVKHNALGVFRLLAEAEALVHGTSIAQVAFHEVGAIDSIIDIVGFCCAWHLLKLDALSVSEIPTGYGTIRCAHGTIPIPAPATAEILKLGKFKICQSNEPYELLTPTGAAILSFFPHSEISGYAAASANSFGTRKLNCRPNLLRAMVIEGNAPEESGSESVWELTANLDDVSGEIAGDFIGQLLELGALDAWLEPIYMKKNRPAFKLALLCRENEKEKFAYFVLKHSGSFGIRMHRCERITLNRKFHKVETKYGPITIKSAESSGIMTAKPEYEDCRKAAAQAGTTVSEVITEALAVYRTKTTRD